MHEICNQYGVVLIFDEIQTFCRCGEWFGAGYYSVTRDIIVLGKGLDSDLPIAAITIQEELEGFSGRAEEIHTFASKSVSQVATAKQIEIIERDHLRENTREMGTYLA